MSETAVPVFIRHPCPPGACECDRDRLLADPASDKRVLALTKDEEKKLLARLEAISTLPELKRMVERMRQLLGIELEIAPGPNEVRTTRGFQIQVAERPGLCRKTRQAIPAAVRRCLESHPDVGYAILDEYSLFAHGDDKAPAGEDR
ncbi:MAG: hypothetical protein JWM30_1212 [Burkholderia sp.]|jgi:hypothetical protein|nr:hypothetical protein [Burkholderia sp.]